MKISMNDAPANVGAFLPAMLTSAKSHLYGMVKVSGHPGDQGVPSPKPSAIPNGPLMRSAQPSYNAPDQWYPSVYYTHVANFHPANNTVRVTSTNEMPIPARSTLATPRVAFNPRKVGGLRQVSWPPAPQTWQNINAGAING